MTTATAHRKSRLLPPHVLDSLPRWRATADEVDPTATVHLFLPGTGWDWYVVEFDGEDTCFGLVSGMEVESGYFSLSELEALRSPLFRLMVERDLHFDPTPLSALREKHAR